MYPILCEGNLLCISKTRTEHMRLRVSPEVVTHSAPDALVVLHLYTT